jgi:signal transduction histidine kinase
MEIVLLSQGSGVVHALLRVPLFAKILLANAVFVVMASLADTRFAAVIIIASVIANALILRVALRPLADLETTVERVGQGDLAARAPRSAVADARLNRLIDTVNETLDSIAASRGHLQDMARGALDVQETERRRIAHELHDDTAQVLAALRLQLESARRQDDRDRRDAQLEQVRDALGEAAERVRRIARGLRPPALDDLGLAPALAAHAESISLPGCRIQVEAGIGRLAPELELALYRILQEAMNNAARHSGATAIAVKLVRTDRAVTASVTDNGRGFDVAGTLAAAGRLGLFGMQERAGFFGGRTSISAAPGKGTTVTTVIPLEPPRA